MTDSAADLDSFFEKKAKKKKGASGDKKKSKSKTDENEAAQNNNSEQDEWGVMQDDLSKSKVTLMGGDDPDGGGVGNTSINNNHSSDMHTIQEEDSPDGKDKQGPWNMTQTNQSPPAGENPPEPVEQQKPAPPEQQKATPPPSSKESTSSGDAGGAYVPRALRNKQSGADATSSGATSSYLPPMRMRGTATPTKPPDVQSQSDFPSLGGPKSNSAQNPWQRSQINSTT